jgi:hypothetical protein
MDSQKNKLTQEQQQIINDLYSNNEIEVIESIKKIRNKGGKYSILPLMDTFFKTDFVDVRKAIAGLFGDLKDNKVSPVITENLLNYSNHEQMGLFLSNIWQSTLAFEDLKIFTELFVISEPKASLECMTIIEQNLANISDANREECLGILKTNIAKFEGFKHELAQDLINIMS